MTKLEIATIGLEMKNNYYKKGGFDFWYKNYPFLWDDEVFTCPCCGEKKTFSDLEVWDDDNAELIAKDEYKCSCCYESSMGEDL
jgi:CRISPR/Cas system-associated protein Cas10 (large subunit of type III CRISPR-Cas system)